MEFLLSVKNGQYNLEKRDGNVTRRTNNQELISRVINSIELPVIRATFSGKDVRMYFGDNKYLMLKNYTSNKNLELYSNVIDYISENTRIIKNVSNVNKNILLVLTGVTFLSLGITGYVHSKKTEVPAIQPNPVIQEIKEETTEEILKESHGILITPSIENEENKSFEDRFKETLLLKNSEFQGIPLATKYDSFYCNNIVNYSNSEIWQHISNYGEQFGVDPYLVLAICYNESNLLHERTIPGGSSYNGSAVGIGQHENPNGSNSVTAFNHTTNQYETEIISMENACDLEMNIKMTTMIIQNKLKKYNNNIYAAIQSYNYGDWAMNTILEQYAKDNNVSVEEVLNNIEDLGWLMYVEHFHNNPQEYLSNWNYKTYGDDEYVKKVIGYYVGTESTSTLPDGTKQTTNLVSLEKQFDTKMR